MIPVIYIIVGSMAGIAAVKAKRKSDSDALLTPDEEMIFKNALDMNLPADKYNKLADVFEAHKHPNEAMILRKRAKLKSLSPEQKAKRKEIIQQAFSSVKPDAVSKIADLFESEGAIGTANDLRKYAASLKDANSIGAEGLYVGGHINRPAPKTNPRRPRPQRKPPSPGLYGSGGVGFIKQTPPSTATTQPTSPANPPTASPQDSGNVPADIDDMTPTDMVDDSPEDQSDQNVANNPQPDDDGYDSGDQSDDVNGEAMGEDE